MMQDYSKPWQEVFPHCVSKTGNRLLNLSSQEDKNRILIYRLKQTHGDYYDFSEVEYRGTKVDVTIVCPDHGPFRAMPNNLLTHASGCPACSGLQKITFEVFVSRSSEIHNNKYTYPAGQVLELSAKQKLVDIVCPVHGVFKQKVAQHLVGHGCRDCKAELIGNIKRKPVELFIKQAKAIHGSRYDYSKVAYVNSSTPVTIICPIHGEFEKSPGSHISQLSGCSKCSGRHVPTTEEFIAKCVAIHGGKYDYSKVQYVNNHRNVTIICPEHGEFYKAARQLAVGKGCPQCPGSNAPSKLIYLLRYLKMGVVKIGVTSNVTSRLTTLRKAVPNEEIELIASWELGVSSRGVEQELLNKYTNKPVTLDKFDGYTELRILTEQEIEDICQYLDSVAEELNDSI